MVKLEDLQIGDAVVFTNDQSPLLKFISYSDLKRHGLGITGKVTELKSRDYDGVPIKVTWDTSPKFSTWLDAEAISKKV